MMQAAHRLKTVRTQPRGFTSARDGKTSPLLKLLFRIACGPIDLLLPFFASLFAFRVAFCARLRRLHGLTAKGPMVFFTRTFLASLSTRPRKLQIGCECKRPTISYSFCIVPTIAGGTISTHWS